MASDSLPTPVSPGAHPGCILSQVLQLVTSARGSVPDKVTQMSPVGIWLSLEAVQLLHPLTLASPKARFQPASANSWERSLHSHELAEAGG